MLWLCTGKDVRDGAVALLECSQVVSSVGAWPYFRSSVGKRKGLVAFILGCEHCSLCCCDAGVSDEGFVVHESVHQSGRPHHRFGVYLMSFGINT